MAVCDVISDVWYIDRALTETVVENRREETSARQLVLGFSFFELVYDLKLSAVHVETPMDSELFP